MKLCLAGVDLLFAIIWGEPERTPNTRETGSGVYLFVSDLAWQQPNAHAQTPRVFVRM